MKNALQTNSVAMPLGYQQRVLFFDPAEIYGRVKINHYSRFQSAKNIGQALLFPKRPDKICSCSCSKNLPAGRSKWASDECANFAADIYAIIYGQPEVIKFYLKKYSGYKCKCGKVRKLKLDHIIPVKKGGGGGWLSNYQFLCNRCHVDKTNDDFGWKKTVKAIAKV